MGCYFAGVGLLTAVVGIIRGAAPLYALIVVPAISFSIFFAFVVGLRLVRAAWWNPATDQVDVSPWFAWLLCGAIVAFFVGSLSVGHREGSEMIRLGWISSLAWVALVSLVWVVARLSKRGA
jgi:hypothetical protein